MSSLAKKINEKKRATLADSENMVVEAYAGTGKTFTQIVGIAWAFGQPVWDLIQRGIAERINEKAGCQKVDPATFVVTPSDEQKVVWDEFAKYQGLVRSITYCAFNKSIVNEFSSEWGWMVDLLQKECEVSLQFSTINGLGHRVCLSAFGKLKPTDKNTFELIGKVLGVDPWDYRKKSPQVVSAVEQLVRLCKQNMTGWTDGSGFVKEDVDDDELDKLCSFYDVELNGTRTTVFDLVRNCLELSLIPVGEMAWDDQNWLPVVNGLPVPKSDMILIDEGQDLNRAKQEFCIRMARGPVFLVGDRFQAIYGFAGADTESIPRMIEMLGARVTRLTETRRCSKAVVLEAQKYVPAFRAHQDNPEGIVRTMAANSDKWLDDAQDGDMVLCRVNAPIVSYALRMIMMGRKAVIRGRNFGQQLIKFIEKLKATDVTDLVAKVNQWSDLEREREMRKKYCSEARLISINDKVACVTAFCDGAEDLKKVLERVNEVFAGKMCPKCKGKYNEETERCYNKSCKIETDSSTGWKVGVKLVIPEGVMFSSIHKAKGLESNRVFFLRTKEAPCPHPMAKTDWQREQENHLCYVAITRAITELVFVTS